MIVVFLCVAAARLARCQDTLPHRTPVYYREDDAESAHDARAADRKDDQHQQHQHRETDTTGSGDMEFYDRVVNYRSNRAIDASRYP